MPFSTAAKNAALDGIPVDRIRLHAGDPGVLGTDNALGAGLTAATFAAASGGERALSAAVGVSGLASNQSVTWFSIWQNSGTVFLGAFQITVGDVTANVSGQYTLSTTTKLTTS
jgi:hypothetical protein